MSGYYAVVSGWCLQYVYASIMGELHGDPTFVANYFKEFSSDPVRPVLWTGSDIPDLSLCNYSWCARRYREGF